MKTAKWSGDDVGAREFLAVASEVASDERIEQVALSVCEVVAEENGTPPSCVEYWGPENRDDWCDRCKSVVDIVAVLTAEGEAIARRNEKE